MVGRVGFEPTQTYISRFTVCPLQPLGYLPIKIGCRFRNCTETTSAYETDPALLLVDPRLKIDACQRGDYNILPYAPAYAVLHVIYIIVQGMKPFNPSKGKVLKILSIKEQLYVKSTLEFQIFKIRSPIMKIININIFQKNVNMDLHRT